jgi:hypothetical protein
MIQPFNLSLSLTALLFFIFLYKKIKIHIREFIEFSGLVLLLSLVNIFLAYFFNLKDVTFYEIIEIILILPKILIITSVGIYFLKKVEYREAVAILKLDKNKFLNEYSFGVIAGIFLSIGSVIILYINNQSIINPISSGALVILIFIINAVLLAIFEETYLRLFIQPILNYFIGKNALGNILSIILTSSIWVFVYYLKSGIDILIMMQLFINGLIFGFIMIKKGFDSCIISHTIFNMINFLLFSNAAFLVKF